MLPCDLARATAPHEVGADASWPDRSRRPAPHDEEGEKMSEATLDNLSTESRSFPPPDGFADQANATQDWYERGDADRDGFWAEQADRLSWAQRWDQVLDWQPPFAKWFVGGKLNVAYNC